ncbi:hypothetical protein JOF56_004190 [Kibdelosporangium banguiense]|uniref:Uncharacterized protein n=1 Tax=Kibdelosporangium banguiense TaxID=1365924 RepID=A0ABS4TH98_9PSEU|nr:hypothetical protein [Kibdelosporangium banguiense]MBP2323805.1 hypothetical protein [Kibdelosporangium banguiense]
MAISTGGPAVASGGDRPLEHGGLLWKPRPGATATAEEFIAARNLVIELHDSVFWNPWVKEDRAREYDDAVAVMGQWTRAEPGFRQITEAELDAQILRMEEDSVARAEEKERQRQARVSEFDEARYEARLELLECDAQVRHMHDERAGLASGERFPLMPESRRAEQIVDLDRSIASVRATQDRLRLQVGDPDTVVDRCGNLPSDRREISLLRFRIWREGEVRKLRAHVDDTDAKLAVKGLERIERGRLRTELDRARYRLNELLALPRQSPDDMCSECVTPMIWHGYTSRGWLVEVGPCPAWPDWARRVKNAREILLASATSRPAGPASPAPQPIAVIPSGLPITDVMKRLAEIQAEHPNAEVRRGSRNKWEIWPARSTSDTTTTAPRHRPTT